MWFLDYNNSMKQIVTYKTFTGKCPYEEWFYKLDKATQARIEKRLERLEEGNYGDFKKINNDLSELRFNFGSGYRIYFTETNDIIVILLCAGDKSSQQYDIKKAKNYLNDLIERNN
jgi:putative addiction module killer protein